MTATEKLKLRRLPKKYAVLAKGSHADHEAMCVMEATAYVAGESWSDHPACASPICTNFAISLNDAIKDDAFRTKLLKPLIPKLVGTRTGAADELRRSYLALDWLVRVYVPTWLELVPTLRARAAQLRDVAPIVDASGFGTSVQALLCEARNDSAAAWDAARDAAWDAAWDAARDAAWAAAGAAAWAAAGAAAGAAARDAAWDAARDAAGDAARDAAWDAARDAARDAAWAAAGDAAGAAAGDAAGDAAGAAAGEKLSPTVEFLQKSAAELLGRMCEVGR